MTVEMTTNGPDDIFTEHLHVRAECDAAESSPASVKNRPVNRIWLVHGADGDRVILAGLTARHSQVWMHQRAGGGREG
jgi:hypothetical protein